jgi:hypothetical protein
MDIQLSFHATSLHSFLDLNYFLYPHSETPDGSLHAEIMTVKQLEHASIKSEYLRWRGFVGAIPKCLKMRPTDQT